MSTLWSDQEKETLKELVIKGLDAPSIELEFIKLKTEGTVGFAAKRSGTAIKKKMAEYIEEPAEYSPYDGRAVEIDELKRLFDRYGESFEPAFRSSNKKDRFVLSLSDLHIPFMPPERIVAILEKHEKDLADNDGVVVLNGDIMDQYGASTFSKFKDVTLLEEYRGAFELVKLCTKFTNKVVLVSGNHEARLGRAAREKLPGPVTSMFGTDLLAKIANGEVIDSKGTTRAIDEDVKRKVRYQYAEKWYVRVGKTIFCHPSGWAGGTPGGTAIKAFEYFKTRYGSNDFDAVVCGHTHRLYKGIVENYMIIEQGSLAGRLGYEGGADLNMSHSQHGYAYIWQAADGTTNFNESNFYSLGSMLPKKKFVVM